MTEVSTAEVVIAKPAQASWESLRNLAEDEESVASLWTGGNAETSVLLNLIDQTRIYPILDDIAEKYADKQIGMAAVLMGEKDDVYTTDRGLNDYTIPSKANVLNGKHNIPRYRIHYHGVGSQLKETDGKLGKSSPALIENVGSIAKFLHINKRISPEHAKPYIAVFDMKDSRDFRDQGSNPQLLAIYPVDLTGILPKKI